MSVIVRKAERRDLPSLGRLGVMLMQTHYDFDRQRFLAPAPGSEAGYASFLGNILESEEDSVFVAEMNGVIAGYVYAALEPLSWKELRGPAGFIHDIVVLTTSRKTGVAKSLMKAALGWLREKGAPRVVVWTAASNETARTMFRRAGFRDTMIEMTMELDSKP
jgi:GNAT superfamily N-acetyltransferase